MKEWFTAAEIATLKLPDLPTDLSAVIRRAKREGWVFRAREASGGGREYPLSALPTAARAAYVARHLKAHEVPVSVAQAAAAEPEAVEIRADAAENRDARLALLAAADAYADEAGIGRKRADAIFAAAYNLDQMPVAPWIKAAVTSLTVRTLARWRAAREAGATHRLAVDKGAARRGRGILETANEGAVKTHCLALLSKNPLLTADQIRDAVGGRFGELVTASGEVAPLPPLRTFQAALKLWKVAHKVDLAALANPDAFKNKYRHSGTNSLAHVRRPNQLWMIDASPVDMLCVDGRYSIYVAVDIFPRRLMVYVTRTPRAEAVGLLMRRAILAWGVPEEVKTDNGSDFVAHYTQRVFAAIGIRRVTSDAFSPEQKGHVERAIRTFQHGCVRLMPGFIGHSVADRKVIEARKSFAARLGEDPREALCVEMTAEEVQRAADEWIAVKYEHRPHEGLAGATPAHVAASSAEPVRTVDVRALDMLLAPVAEGGGVRTVTKFGVRIKHHHYRTPDLLPGREVLVRMDPADLGRAYLFDVGAHQYLGEAECPELLGIDPKVATAATREAQARLIAERTAEVRKEAKTLTKGPRLVDVVNRYNARKAGKLVELPRHREAHTTPALKAAGQASAPREAPKPRVSAEVRALRDQLAAAPSQDASVVSLRSADDGRQRFRRAGDLIRRMKRGEPLDPADAQWLAGYIESSEFKGFRLTYGAPEEQAPASAG